MGTMAEERHAIHALGIARATQMAFVAGKCIERGMSVDEALEAGRRANVLFFGPWPIESAGGKFFDGIESSVDRFIRCEEAGE